MYCLETTAVVRSCNLQHPYYMPEKLLIILTINGSFTSAPSGKCQYDTHSFHIRSSSFFTNHPILRVIKHNLSLSSALQPLGGPRPPHKASVNKSIISQSTSTTPPVYCVSMLHVPALWGLGSNEHSRKACETTVYAPNRLQLCPLRPQEYRSWKLEINTARLRRKQNAEREILTAILTSINAACI